MKSVNETPLVSQRLGGQSPQNWDYPPSPISPIQPPAPTDFQNQQRAELAYWLHQYQRETHIRQPNKPNPVFERNCARYWQQLRSGKNNDAKKSA